jgi:hypothetical protein
VTLTAAAAAAITASDDQFHSSSDVPLSHSRTASHDSHRSDEDEEDRSVLESIDAAEQATANPIAASTAAKQRNSSVSKKDAEEESKTNDDDLTSVSTSSPVVAATPDVALLTTSDLLHSIFRFYSHPSSLDDEHDVKKPIEMVMSRTELFAFLVECDLLHALVTLGEKIPHYSEDLNESTEEEVPPLFQRIWSAYSSSFAPPSANGEPAAVEQTQRVLVFKGFAEFIGHLAFLLAPSTLLPPSLQHFTHEWPPKLSSSVSASLLIHLLEHTILPSSSLYNPAHKSTDLSTNGSSVLASEVRFHSSPALALLVLFRLESFVELYERYLGAEKGRPQAVVRGETPTATDAERTIAREVQWAALRKLDKAFLASVTHSSSGSEELITPPIFASVDVSSTLGSAGVTASLTYDEYLAICLHKHRYDASTNSLRYSATVTLSVFVEVLLQAAEKRAEHALGMGRKQSTSASSPPSRQERQQACVAFLQQLLDL